MVHVRPPSLNASHRQLPAGVVDAQFRLARSYSRVKLNFQIRPQLNSIGMKRPKLNSGSKASRRVLRRVERVEELPPQQQATLLRTIDTFLKAAEN